MTKLKITKIEKPEALAAVKEFHDGRERMTQEFEALQKRQQVEISQFTSEYRNYFRRLFRTATEGIVEFPDDAFAKDTHILEHRFIDMGDAYVIEVPQEDSKPTEVPENLPGPSRIVKH